MIKISFLKKKNTGMMDVLDLYKSFAHWIFPEMVEFKTKDQPKMFILNKSNILGTMFVHLCVGVFFKVILITKNKNDQTDGKDGCWEWNKPIKKTIETIVWIIMKKSTWSKSVVSLEKFIKLTYENKWA